jgi:DNA-binding IclR family transcriptional regulator
VIELEKEKMVMDAFQKAGRPLSSKEVAELSGLEKPEVDKLIKQLKNDGKINSPKRCYYAPV